MKPLPAFPSVSTPRFTRCCRTLILGLTLPLLLARSASAQESRNVTLLSHMDRYDEYSSCWSYVHHDGREYAVEFATTGASIVRLADPRNPVEVAFIGLRTSQWHEARQYRNWLYVTTEIFNGVPSGNGLEIISMMDPEHPKVVGSFHPGIDWAHTVEIDTTRAILYAPGAPGGMAIYSLADPENPVQIALFSNQSSEIFGYIHTIHVRGTRGYASLTYDGLEQILDLTDPAHPAVLASFPTPAGITHSSWTTEDQRYLFVTDETNGARLYLYDIQDLSNVRRIYTYEELNSRTTPHDPVIRGTLAFVSYYTAGARILDVSNPAWPVEVGFYDTFPGPDGGYNGCWEAAPMFPSGIFIASDTETGLYVLRPELNYAIVRGTVSEAPNGPIVPGVAVVQSPPGGASTHSYSDGRYAIAVTPGAAVTLQTSLFGYDPLVKTVAAPAGSDQTLALKIRRSDAGSVTGVVRRASDQAPLREAEIQILGTPLTAMSDAAGVYTISSVPVGTYSVRCLCPGQVPTMGTVTVTKGKSSALGFSLASALAYDDAESDRGWSLGASGDDATRGLWIRDVPLGTIEQLTGLQVQTDHDRSPAPGAKCFVTGNRTSGNPNFFFDQTVTGGKTTLTSPPLHLAGVQDPRIGFWRWYVNFVGDFDADDPFVTQLSGDGGGTWTSVDSLLFSEPGWQYFEIPVANYIPNPGDVMIRFIAMDQGERSFVEAAIDDIALYSGAGSGPAQAASIADGPYAPAAVVGRIRPSPTRGDARVELSLRKATSVRAELFDVQGRLVRTIHDGMLPEGLQTLRWDGRLANGTAAAAGVYWFRVNAAGVVRTSRLVVLR